MKPERYSGVESIDIFFDAQPLHPFAHVCAGPGPMYSSQTKKDRGFIPTRASTVEAIIAIAASECPSGAITYQRHDGGLTRRIARPS